MTMLARSQEYRIAFDSSNIPSTSSAWTLTSPNATVWTPSITTAGIVSLTSGGVAGETAVLVGVDGTKWTPTISNGGIITLTSGGTLSASDTIATLTDSGDTIWSLYVDDAGQANVTTASALPGLLRYPSFLFSYTPSAGTDVCVIQAIRVNVTIRRRSA